MLLSTVMPPFPGVDLPGWSTESNRIWQLPASISFLPLPAVAIHPKAVLPWPLLFVTGSCALLWNGVVRGNDPTCTVKSKSLPDSGAQKNCLPSRNTPIPISGGALCVRQTVYQLKMHSDSNKNTSAYTEQNHAPSFTYVQLEFTALLQLLLLYQDARYHLHIPEWFCQKRIFQHVPHSA